MSLRSRAVVRATLLALATAVVAACSKATPTGPASARPNVHRADSGYVDCDSACRGGFTNPHG